MLAKIKQHLVPVIVLAVLSCVPFLWLQDGAVILGHDAGTPLAPAEHFQDRLELWTYRYGGGSDQTFAVAGFFLHGFEYVLDQLPLSVSDQQKLEFSIYFFLMGGAMYLATQLIFPKVKPEFALLAAVVYEFNHFILQAWFIAERTKFSVYIILPILTAIFFVLTRKKVRPVLAGLLSGILLTIFNGGGFLPLYASLFLTLGTAAIAHLLLDKQALLKKIRELVVYGGSFIGAYLICNTFWLLPYYWYVKTSFTQLVGEAGGISGILNWVTAISENTSFLNLLRLQGIQEWYVNPEHPYAAAYFSNPFLIILSFVPILVIAVAFLLAKRTKSRVLAVLLLILLLALFLMAGSHKPFGFIYVLFLKYIPGFIAFRTPYYKFAPAFFFVFGLLVSYVAAHYLTTVKRRSVIVGVIIIVYLSYNFPFFTKNIFQYTSERTTKVIVPEYVYDYENYIAENPDDLTRTALFPGLNLNDYTSQYKWGYWSLAPLHSLLDRHQYLLPAPATNLETELVAEFYRALLLGKPEWMELAQTLGVDSIVVQSDFSQFSYLGYDSDEVGQGFASNENLTLLHTFGEWKVYKIAIEHQLHPNYVQLSIPFSRVGEIFNISDFVFNEQQLNNPVVFSSYELPEMNRVGTVIKAACQDCQIRREQAYIANPNVVFIPGSKLGVLGKLFGITYEYGNVQSDSLQKLYILQALIQRKEPSQYRLPIWERYLSDLDAYQQLVDTEVAAQSLNHSNILNTYSNIEFQKNGLQDISVFVNTAQEAELYQAALYKVRSIQEKLLAINTITTNSNTYRLTFTPANAGRYQMYAYNELLNGSTTKQPVQFTVNDQQFSSIIEDDTWTEVGSLELEEKEYILEITDTKFENPATIPESVTIGDEQPCAELTKLTLPAGLYSLNLAVVSPETNANLTVHVHKKGEPQPLLPFWGSPIELLQNLNKTSIIAFDIAEETETTLLLCAFALKSPTQFEVATFDLNRQTNPIIFMYNSENEPIPATGTYQINRTSNTTNTYQFAASAPSLLNTLHPFNPNWQLADPAVTAVRINEGMHGYIVPAGEGELREEYSLQKYHQWGVYISSIGGLVVVTTILYLLYIKKK